MDSRQLPLAPLVFIKRKFHLLIFYQQLHPQSFYFIDKNFCVLLQLFDSVPICEVQILILSFQKAFSFIFILDGLFKYFLDPSSLKDGVVEKLYLFDSGYFFAVGAVVLVRCVLADALKVKTMPARQSSYLTAHLLQADDAIWKLVEAFISLLIDFFRIACTFLHFSSYTYFSIKEYQYHFQISN